MSGDGDTIVAGELSLTQPGRVIVYKVSTSTTTELSFGGVNGWNQVAVNGDGSQIYATSITSGKSTFLYKVVSGASGSSCWAA